VGIQSARQVLALIGTVAFLMTPAVAVVALLAPVLRFRRAQGVERQQLKWFAYAAFLLVAGGAALSLAADLYVGNRSDEHVDHLS
jgi:hypothetical protein